MLRKLALAIVSLAGILLFRDAFVNQVMGAEDPSFREPVGGEQIVMPTVNQCGDKETIRWIFSDTPLQGLSGTLVFTGSMFLPKEDGAGYDSRRAVMLFERDTFWALIMIYNRDWWCIVATGGEAMFLKEG